MYVMIQLPWLLLNPAFASHVNGIIVDYRIQPPRSTDILRPSTGNGQPSVSGLIRGGTALAAATATPTADPITATLVHPIVGSQMGSRSVNLLLNRLIKELNLDELAARKLREAVKQLLDGLKLSPGTVVATYEVPINTTGIYADAMTGVCSACDTHTIETQELEKKKLALEVERLRISLLTLYSVKGSVRSAGGPISTAVVSLLGVGGDDEGKIFAQETSDESGFYGIAAGGLLREGRSYRVTCHKNSSAVYPCF